MNLPLSAAPPEPGPPVSFQLDGDVAHIVLAGPRCNAIGQRFLRHLERVLDRVEDAAPAVVLLRSADPTGFCQGDDLVEAHERFVTRDSALHRLADRVLPGGRADPLCDALAVDQFLRRIHRALNRLERLDAPTVCLVRGLCMGGGWELAAACDLLVAEKNARFGLPELRLATLPAFGAVPRLERDLPGALLRDLLLTGRTVSATRLHAVGAVHQVVPTGRGESAARALAARLARLDRDVVAHTKAFTKPTPWRRLVEERVRVLWLTSRPAFRRALARVAEAPAGPMTYL
jgi:enoyl-CoA hydratase/carnithine racemase